MPVGGCVNHLNDEAWDDVSGFLVLTCRGRHDGQVFVQDDSFEGNAADARAACDAARSERVNVPGYIDWWSYYGDGNLTCVLYREDGTSLTSSVVPA